MSHIKKKWSSGLHLRSIPKAKLIREHAATAIASAPLLKFVDTDQNKIYLYTEAMWKEKMITRLNNVMTAVRDLEIAIKHHQRLGFTITPGGSQAKLGTHNAIIQFEQTYLELVSPIDPIQVMSAIPNTEIVLDILDQRDGCVIGFALQTTDIQQEVKKLQETQLVVTPPYTLERIQPGRESVKMQIFMPGGLPWRRPWPFLYQWEKPEGQTMTTREEAIHQNGIRDIMRVSIAVKNLQEATELYQKYLGLELYRQDFVPRLNAKRITFRIGASPMLIDLLMPQGPGPLMDDITSLGEGVFEVVLGVDKIDRTQAFLNWQGIQFTPNVAGPETLLLSPDETFQTRYLLMQIP